MTSAILQPHTATMPLNAAALSPKHTAQLEKAKTQAQEFESVFLNTMLSQMFSGLEGEGPMGAGNGSGSATWRSILTEEYANLISSAGGVGIADSVLKEILTLQEG